MKHIKIHSLGPLQDVDIDLKKVNVLIGPQSSGKSCVLKTLCYCTWVEKRIELLQSPEFFQREGAFVEELVRFHKLKGYLKPDTFIEYESDYMHFSYDHATGQLQFEWKERWAYKRSKVTYIPAERNMVAVIPNWFEVKLADDNIRDFMSDWEMARKATHEQLRVLNLEVSYHYEPSSNADRIRLEDGQELDFTNTSSGLQSLIPLFVHLNYLDKLQYEQERSESVKRDSENWKLLNDIHRTLFALEIKYTHPKEFVWETIGQLTLPFADRDAAERCKEIYSRYSTNHFCDIFLEEPEENLFPPTQTQLVNWLLEMTEGEHASNLFIATHSPYIVTSLLERQTIDLGLFFTYFKEGVSYMKTASEQDIQEIYDNGVDVFFNLETFTDE